METTKPPRDHDSENELLYNVSDVLVSTKAHPRIAADRGSIHLILQLPKGKLSQAI